MSFTFPDPPAVLAGAPLAFYDELRQMLGVVRPARVDTDKSSVQFKKDGVELNIAHTERPDLSIWATVGDHDTIVGAGGAHEHFFAPSAEQLEERPWTTQMVDFIAEILRGQIEVETTFRGSAVLSVRHFQVGDGQRDELGCTGFLHPARLLFWRPKRTETEHLSFR